MGEICFFLWLVFLVVSLMLCGLVFVVRQWVEGRRDDE